MGSRFEAQREIKTIYQAIRWVIMGLTSFITRTRAKIHSAHKKDAERQQRKALLVRNKATNEAERKENLAEARESLARAKERKARAQAKLDKGKKETDWRAIGKKFFSRVEGKPVRKKTVKKVVRKRAKRG